MDHFDKEVLQALKDKDPRNFPEVLPEISFSHNTLREHLDKIIQQDIINRQKAPQQGPERPTYVYSLLPEVKRRLA